MKKPISHRLDADLKAYPITNIVNGWFFRINEISQGYYRVEGIDRSGHNVSRDGIDPNELFAAIKKDILEMGFNH